MKKIALVLILVPALIIWYRPAPAASGFSAITIAASNAPAAVKARADIVCDEVGDDVPEILNAYSMGKAVEFSEGAFKLGSQTIVVPDYGTIRGQGMSTLFVVQNGSNKDAIQIGKYGTVKDFRINGNKTNQTSGNGIAFTSSYYTKVENVMVQDVKEAGFQINGMYDYSTAFAIDFSNVISNVNGYGLRGTYYQNSYIESSYFEGNSLGNVYLTNPTDLHFSKIWIEGQHGLFASNSNNLTITGSEIGTRTGTNIGIHLVNAVDPRITNSLIRGIDWAIYIQNTPAKGFILSDLTIDAGTGTGRGIQIDGAAPNGKVGNVISVGNGNKSIVLNP